MCAAKVFWSTPCFGYREMIFEVGEELRLKKAHPCGSDRFKVIASASDVKIECLGCGHRLIMEIDKLKRSVKTRIGSGNDRKNQENP